LHNVSLTKQRSKEKLSPRTHEITQIRHA